VNFLRSDDDDVRLCNSLMPCCQCQENQKQQFLAIAFDRALQNARNLISIRDRNILDSPFLAYE